jgi:hypothetical protein
MGIAPADDLDRSPRTPATIPIRLVVESEDFRVEHDASTVDLSVGGIKVRLPLALLPGETVGIIARGNSRQTIPARVIWAQRAGADLWFLAGLEFLETLPA